RLAGAHRAREQDAHRHARGLAVADVLRDARQLFFYLVDAADDREVVRRVDELDEPEAFALDHFALALADQAQDLLVRLVADTGRRGLADQVLDVVARHALRDRRELPRARVVGDQRLDELVARVGVVTRALRRRLQDRLDLD